MQVADRVAVPGAMDALVQAHGPAAHPVAGAADPFGGLDDVGLGQPGDGGHPVRGVVIEKGRQFVPAFGVAGDEVGVGVAVTQQHVQQAIEQGHVAAGAHLQEQVGLVGGGAAPWVDDDQLGTRLDPVEQAQEQDRVTVGHVGADHQEHVGVLEVLVAAGRAIGTERQLVAAAGTGHAQARVGLDVAGADKALGQFVGQVLGLQRHLPGDIQRHGIGPVLVDDLAQACGAVGDGLVHAAARGLLRALLADERVFHAPWGAEGHVCGEAFGAEAAKIAWVLFVAADLADLAVGHAHDDAAPDPAIRANAAYFAAAHGPVSWLETQKAPAAPACSASGGNTAPLS
ncbi:hypothetical protein D3C79_520920 [compost metagenome]